MAYNDDKSLLSILQDLVSVNLCSYKAYTHAAVIARAGYLRAIFDDLAKQRREFAEELTDEIRQRGGEPPSECQGGLNGLQAGSDRELLTLAADNEAEVFRRYQEALVLDLPLGLRAQLQLHFLDLLETSSRFNSMAPCAE
jgi:Domain of unknown function (DUF2383).